MKSICITHPLNDIERMTQLMDRFFGETAPVTSEAAALDVFEKDNHLIVRAAVPGVRMEDLDIQIEGRVLTIQGETRLPQELEEAKVYRREVRTGRTTRSLRLPEGLELDRVEATLAEGILTLRLPRQQPEKPSAIKVEVKPA